MPSDRQLLELILRRQQTQTKLLLMLLQGEREIYVKAQELLDQEAAGLTSLEASDKLVLEKLASGDDLTEAEVTEGQQVLARIAALQAGDDAAVAGTPVTTTPPTDTVGDDGTGTPGGGADAPTTGDGSVSVSDGSNV